MSLWQVPDHPFPIDATVTIPGSKSHTARALLLAAIADGPSRISGALRCRDTSLMRAALTSLGASITDRDNGDLVIQPIPRDAIIHGDRVDIDCGLAGTVMRFLPAIVAALGISARFDGDAAARLRPMGPLLEALHALGVSISYEGEAGFLPFTLDGKAGAVPGGVIEVDTSASSQFLSALLLAAPLFDQPTAIRAVGSVISAPHIDMTVEALRGRGITIDKLGEYHWEVTPGRPNGGNSHVEPDLSNAGVFLAAAMLTAGQIHIPSWPLVTTQAGDYWRTLLADLGASISLDEGGLTLIGPGAGAYSGLDIDMRDFGELVPTLAAILLFASSPSRIRGVGHLRGHETDRLAALADSVTRLGGTLKEESDGISITPTSLSGATLRAWGDHRLATFAAIVGLIVPGVIIDEIEATSKTLPDFPQMWESMLAKAH
ncbi:MAG: 3-phosphoshikimate 1-carboxyvinyltransferase [Actinomycetaceae bacterium]|nr:3-phosphoshikimate 1-carboxyvinyltransferase [Actinomycetaceae bacterium]